MLPTRACRFSAKRLERLHSCSIGVPTLNMRPACARDTPGLIATIRTSTESPGKLCLPPENHATQRERAMPDVSGPQIDRVAVFAVVRLLFHLGIASLSLPWAS